MYQYLFSEEDQYPFTLFTMKLRQELPLSRGSDLITDYPVKDALVIMENSDENLDDFLNILEVCISYAVAIVTRLYMVTVLLD